MPLRLFGKNLDIGDALRRHVIVSGQVVISPEVSAYRTDCSLTLGSGTKLRVGGRHRKPHASFERASDKINYRSSNEVAVGGSGRLKDAAFVIVAADDFGEAPADYSPVTVAELSQALNNLSDASAVAEPELTGAPLVGFQHATSERAHILDRQSDGASGRLDPH